MGVKLPYDVIESSGICQNCFIKFNEIDEHQLTINKIQGELLELFGATQAGAGEIKAEVKVEDDMGEVVEVYEVEEGYSDGEHFISEVLDDDDDDGEMTEVDGKRRRGPKKKKNLDEGLIMVEVDGQKFYQCDVCQKTCKDRYKLKNHKETHNEERNICCTECGAMFKTLSCLYSHKKIHMTRHYHAW
jgi:hypothetical protein